MTCKLEVEMDVAFCASSGWRIICIGDQHGEIGLMRQLLERATELKTTAPQTKIVYLGDLIDRGPDSLACLDLAISSQTFDGIDAVATSVAITKNCCTRPSLAQRPRSAWWRKGAGK